MTTSEQYTDPSETEECRICGETWSPEDLESVGNFGTFDDEGCRAIGVEHKGWPYPGFQDRRA